MHVLNHTKTNTESKLNIMVHKLFYGHKINSKLLNSQYENSYLVTYALNNVHSLIKRYLDALVQREFLLTFVHVYVWFMLVYGVCV